MKHFLPFVILFAAFLGSEGNAEDADTYYLLPNKSFALKGLGANQFLAGSNVKVLTPGDRSGSAWVIEIDGGQFNIDQLANMGLSLEAIATKKEVEPKNTRPFTEVDLRSAIMFAYGDDGYYALETFDNSPSVFGGNIKGLIKLDPGAAVPKWDGNTPPDAQNNQVRTYIIPLKNRTAYDGAQDFMNLFYSQIKNWPPLNLEFKRRKAQLAITDPAFWDLVAKELAAFSKNYAEEAGHAAFMVTKTIICITPVVGNVASVAFGVYDIATGNYTEGVFECIPAFPVLHKLTRTMSLVRTTEDVIAGFAGQVAKGAKQVLDNNAFLVLSAAKNKLSDVAFLRKFFDSKKLAAWDYLYQEYRAGKITIDQLKFMCTGVYCFTPNTLVVMADGSKKQIGAIRVGDLVASWDEASGVTSTCPVVAKQSSRSSEDLFRLEFDQGGPPILVTPSHPFWVVNDSLGTWRLTKDLAIGDVFVTHAGKRRHLTGKFQLPDSAGSEVVNITVAHDHTMFVGEQAVLAHNACLRDIFTDLKILGANKVGWFNLFEAAHPSQIAVYFDIKFMNPTAITAYKALFGARIRSLSPGKHEWLPVAALWEHLLPHAAKLEGDAGRKFMAYVTKFQDKVRIDNNRLWYNKMGNRGYQTVDGKQVKIGHAGGKDGNVKYYTGQDNAFHEAVQKAVGEVLSQKGTFDPAAFKKKIVDDVLPKFFEDRPEEKLNVLTDVKKLFEDAVDAAVKDLNIAGIKLP